MSYNIQMNYFDGSVYQELYPYTIDEQILCNYNDSQENLKNILTQINQIITQNNTDIGNLKNLVLKEVAIHTKFYNSEILANNYSGLLRFQTINTISDFGTKKYIACFLSFSNFSSSGINGTVSLWGLADDTVDRVTRTRSGPFPLYGGNGGLEVYCGSNNFYSVAPTITLGASFNAIRNVRYTISFDCDITLFYVESL